MSDAPTLLSITIDDLHENGQQWLTMMRPVIGTDLLASQYLSRGGAKFACPYFDIYEGFEETSSPTYSSHAGLNRPEPIMVYDGTDNRYIRACLHLVATERAQIDGQTITPFHWLSALNLPFYSEDGIRYSPPPIYLTIGSVLRMRSVVENIETRWVGPWERNFFVFTQPHGVDITMTFCAVGSAFMNYGSAGGLDGRTHAQGTFA